MCTNSSGQWSISNHSTSSGYMISVSLTTNVRRTWCNKDHRTNLVSRGDVPKQNGILKIEFEECLIPA